MEIGMIGLGRAGADMARCILAAGHRCVVYDPSAEAVQALEQTGAVGAYDLSELIAELELPRVLCLMVPAADTDRLIDALAKQLEADDILIDGGSSHYRADIARARRLAPLDIRYLDVGSSGSPWSGDPGYCLMIGGDAETVQRVEPIFRALAPGNGTSRTPGREGPPAPEEQGWLHCGPVGAGHFVKMAYEGIEQGILSAYAEGLNTLRRAGDDKAWQEPDAKNAALAAPTVLPYAIDLAKVTEVWRHGSLISSWLLDLTAGALLADSGTGKFVARVSDSGKGCRSSVPPVEASAPRAVLATSLFARLAEPEEVDCTGCAPSAMPLGFGHQEKRV